MPSISEKLRFWNENGFKNWSALTEEEKAEIKKETTELAGGAEDEYAKFVWLRGYKNAWYFIDPATNPWGQA